MSRGMLTEEIQIKYKELFDHDHDLTTRELRVLPYIQYCLINGGYIDLDKVDNDELRFIEDILSRNGCYLNDNILSCDIGFWVKLNSVLFISYVNRED